MPRRRPLKTLSFPVDLAGLDVDEHRSRVADLLEEKRAKFPSVFADGNAASGAKKGIEQRVAQEMRDEEAADRASLERG
jgi:hypothetical protein